jgi:DHA1 family tetracycline resistance protein-like MFS transporter
MRKTSRLIIFITVFIDLVGFGIVMPLLPLYSQKFGASGLMIGMIVASYSVMQFIFAPVWGGWSDRIGRRPVLLISNAGSALSYILFGFASTLESSDALWLLLGSRIFAGICGANLSVASAYMADVSPPEKRSKSMGLIGMAVGLGFIFGPAIGSFSAKQFGLAGPGMVAGGICAANFVLSIFILGESLKPSSKPRVTRVRLAQWTHVIGQPIVGFLVILFFLATFCFAAFEVTIGLLLQKKFGYDQEQLGYYLTYCGVLSALVQGGGIGPLVKRFGERKLIAMSLALLAISLIWLPYVSTVGGLLGALAVLAIGSGLNRPPLFGMISKLTPEHEQGATLGVAQSSGSLARIVAPIFAGTIYYVRYDLPYVICAGLSLFAAGLCWYVLVTRGTRQSEPIPSEI